MAGAACCKGALILDLKNIIMLGACKQHLTWMQGPRMEGTQRGRHLRELQPGSAPKCSGANGAMPLLAGIRKRVGSSQGFFPPPLHSFFQKWTQLWLCFRREPSREFAGDFKSKQHLARGATSLARLGSVLSLSQTFPAEVLRTQTPTLLGFTLLRMLIF